MKKTIKGFDCVDMKRRIQEKIREETKDMDSRQFAQYMQKRIEASRFASFLKRPASAGPSETRYARMGDATHITIPEPESRLR